MEIKTSYFCKPIPTRRYDWSAVRDNYEEGDPIGHGKTELDAIGDLLAQEFENSIFCTCCEKQLKDKFLQIDGHTFCNETCEDEYYTHRAERIKSNKPTLIRMIKP